MRFNKRSDIMFVILLMSSAASCMETDAFDLDTEPPGFEKQESLIDEDDSSNNYQCADGGECPAGNSGESCSSDFECECEKSGNWYDSATGLCWQNPPKGDAMTLDDAVSHCQDGAFGGFDDWELPNIEELISLRTGCRDGIAIKEPDGGLCEMQPEGCAENDACEAAGHCDECAAGLGPDSDPSGCYWVSPLSGSCNRYWSSSQAGNREFFWYVDFMSGLVSDYQRPYVYHARCVRRRM